MFKKMTKKMTTKKNQNFAKHQKKIDFEIPNFFKLRHNCKGTFKKLALKFPILKS